MTARAKPARPSRPTRREKGGKGEKASARAERLAQIRAAQQARERRRIILIWSGAIAAVVVIATAVTVSLVVWNRDRPTLSAVTSTDPDRGHVTTAVTYPQTPPAGGQHAPVWLNCGTYPQPVTNENAVHSMEHGAVWVTYQPTLPADQVQALQAALPSTYTLLSPYPGLPSPVVASAWGKQLTLQSATDPRLAEFIRTYRQSPQAPEPGAACTGGTNGTQGTSGTGTGGTQPGPAGPGASS